MPTANHGFRRFFQVLTVGAALLALWLLSTEPWGLGVLQLVVFTAPGALLGLGAGWMAHATARTAWTWQHSARSAARGATILPPILAFVVALDGNDRPPHLLEGFVRAAWLALAIGGAVAVARLVRGRRAAKRSALSE